MLVGSCWCMLGLLKIKHGKQFPTASRASFSSAFLWWLDVFLSWQESLVSCKEDLTDPYTYPYISCIILYIYIHIFIIYPYISSYILIETCHLG